MHVSGIDSHLTRLHIRPDTWRDGVWRFGPLVVAGK